MRVSKSRWRGALITDLNELVDLTKHRESVIVYIGGGHRLLPASFIVNWPLRMILNMKIYNALDYAPKNRKKP